MSFWQEHQVGGPYATVEESSLALRDRMSRYPELGELMPVSHPGKTVLDYGCGPGHDTILFSQLGADVWYTDTSDLALRTTRQRLRMHGLPATQLSAFRRFDHVHCAGVLHHVEDPDYVLGNLAAFLNPGGTLRLMVYDGYLSTHSQSKVPITHWWTDSDVIAMARKAGLEAQYQGSYECSAEWRPDCYAACYLLT